MVWNNNELYGLIRNLRHDLGVLRFKGNVQLIAGTNITLTDDLGQNGIIIAAAGGGAGAPSDARYVVTELHAGLSAEELHPTLGTPSFDVRHDHGLDLSNVLADQHHAQLHRLAHEVGGGDLINLNLLTGVATRAQLPALLAYEDESNIFTVLQQLNRGLATDNLIEGEVSGDTVPRFAIRADGQLEWGGGAAAVDTTLARLAANLLGTGVGDSFRSGNDFEWLSGTSFLGVLAHANTVNRTYTFPDATDTIVLLALAQSLSNKTLVTPTIADFVNAQHGHANSAGGSQVNHGDLLGVTADQHHARQHGLEAVADHTLAGATAGEYLRATGATTFAMEAPPFSKTAIVLSPAVDDLAMWRAPFACTVTAIKGYQNPGTGSTINAFRGSLASPVLFRSANLSITPVDSWVDGGAVQNTAVAAGTAVYLRIATLSGSPTEIGVQLDFTRP